PSAGPTRPGPWQPSAAPGSRTTCPRLPAVAAVQRGRHPIRTTLTDPSEMLRYLVKRLSLSVVALFVVSVVTFLMFFAVLSDPAVLMCGKQCSPHQLAQTRTRLGLDQPLTTQYAEYVKGIFVGRTFGS